MGLEIERFPAVPARASCCCPGELVPLHIFEERYKQMIGECLDEEREFGILWLADDELKEVGCAARVTRVLERFEDGRLNILAEGTTPVPHGAPHRRHGLPRRRRRPARRRAGRRRRRARARPHHLRRPGRGGDRRAARAETLAGLDAYGMAATVDINPAAKQALLELRSEPARLEQLEGLFAEALRRIRTAARVAEQASGNGHLKPGE